MTTASRNREVAIEGMRLQEHIKVKMVHLRRYVLRQKHALAGIHPIKLSAFLLLLGSRAVRKPRLARSGGLCRSLLRVHAAFLLLPACESPCTTCRYSIL